MKTECKGLFWRFSQEKWVSKDGIVYARKKANKLKRKSCDCKRCQGVEELFLELWRETDALNEVFEYADGVMKIEGSSNYCSYTEMDDYYISLTDEAGNIKYEKHG